VTRNRIISTFFGLGLLPWFPGTWGSLAGLGLAILAKDWVLGIAVVLLFFVGVWSSDKTAREVNKSDPGEVVIDEVVGMGVSLLFLPHHWIFWVSGFVLFRLFDIKKPGPIRKLEQFPGGWGIMLDDLGAGIMTNILLQMGHLLYLLSKIWS